MTNERALERITIVGLGLIGGSIARGLKRAGFAGECVGVVADESQRLKGQHLGIVDRVELDVGQAADSADLVIVAVPIGAIDGVLAQLSHSIGPTTVITDVGSAKYCVMASARLHLGDAYARFVPGHPIAGTEQNGLEAGFASLFDDRCVVLTPDEATADTAIARVTALWESLGARVDHLSANVHDRLLAATSHLPHALAFTLVDMLASGCDAEAVFDYAAGGFADFTRIAASDPIVWRDIFAANRDALVATLDDYMQALGETRRAIAQNDTYAMFERISRAKQVRDQLPTARAK